MLGRNNTKRNASFFFSSFLFFCLITCCILHHAHGAEQSKGRPLFEKLSGTIDDCCCEVQSVDHSLHDENMHSVLEQLITSTFFRYFKVNYLKECPFWVENALCGIDGPGECGLNEADENEIPQAWDVKPTNEGTIRMPWKEKDEDVWIIQDDTEDTVYVNLQTNPERYTGYGDKNTNANSNNIWLMIYKENCFPDPFECMEQRVFYRLISGLHASTNAHICENYHYPNNTWGPNLDMFLYRLGAFPDRMKNIYFTFVYLLRAAHKASDFLSHYDYNTAHPEEDKRVQSLVRTLLSSSLLCSAPFDESNLFQGERAVLKREFMAKFRNISEIMDCVSCQTCKVHAKLQILGIATATKILIADDPTMIQGLQHNEISSLINTLFKFSESIQIIHKMKAREEEHLKQLREKEGGEKEDTEGQSTFQRHSSLIALISVVVLITVATLYSRNNILKTQNNNSKAKEGKKEGKRGEKGEKAKVNGANKDNSAEESNKAVEDEDDNNNAKKKTSSLRRSSDKVKNNHNTKQS